MPVEQDLARVSKFMDHEDKKSIPRRQSKPRKESAPKLTEEQQIEVNKAVAAAVVQFQEQVDRQRTKLNEADLEVVDTILSEHIGPYILIGFNLNNEPIEIFSAGNALEAGALSDHFKKVFVERAVRLGQDLM